MKKSLGLLAALAILPLSLLADTPTTIKVGGIDRQYYTYIPADLGENRPLLVSMHGMNQDAMYQKGMLQIESVADTAKFAVAFPEGIDRAWDISGTRDINFVLAIIDQMATDYGIDKDRVYLSGFSMGGMFTYHAMNHIADRIAAFAPISGYPMGGQPFESSRPVPIIHTHGTADDVVVYDNVQARIDGWIARNGCASTPQVTNKYRGGDIVRYQWGPGDEGAEVVLIERAGKGHWIANENFLTGEEIWNFCKRYRVNANLPTVTISSPANDLLFNVMGRGTILGSMPIKADAKGFGEAAIAKVDFYCDDALVATCTEAPYECEWTDVPNGDHMVKAVATDNLGVSVARAVPVKVSNRRYSCTPSNDFEDGFIPAGWIIRDGRQTRIGPFDGKSGGCRVLEFTGSPRDFDLAIWGRNSSGGADKAYIAYGDFQGKAVLYCTPGVYHLSFDACNYDRPDFSPIRCDVLDAVTDEVIASTTFTPSCNVGGNTANSFTGVSHINIDFTEANGRFVKFYFYLGEVKTDDALIANLRLKLDSAGIDDAEAPVSEIVSVSYYDLLGRPASANSTGVLVRRTVFADGSAKAQKVIVGY